MERETTRENNNRFNKVFPAFDLLNKEFSPGSCIIVYINDRIFDYFLLLREEQI